MLPDRLVEFVRASMVLEAARSAGDARCVAEAGGMTLGGTIGRSAHMRPDGSIWIYEAVDWVNSEEYQWRAAERQEGFGWLKVAAKRLPELAELLPVRGQTNPACPRCNGTGDMTREGHQLTGIWCEDCVGLGWIVP
jgi:hypothetical protein